MPSQDNKQTELSRIKNKVLEVESQLIEQKKITEKLRDASEKKFREVSIVDAELTAEMERFKWKREEFRNQYKYAEEESQEKIMKYISTENLLTEAVAGSDVVERENSKLHARLKEVALEQMQNLHLQKVECGRKKQRDFDIRLGIEELFRKSVKLFDSGYKEEAIAKMELEAAHAHAENNRIHKEFDLREVRCEQLIHQQQKSFDQLIRIRLNRDVQYTSTEIQEKRIQKLREENFNNEMDLQHTKKQLQELRHQLLCVRNMFNERKAYEQYLDELQEKLLKAQRKRKKLYKSVISFANSVLEESISISKQEIKSRSENLSKLADNLIDSAKEDENMNNTSSKTSTLVQPVEEKQIVKSTEQFNLEDIWRYKEESKKFIYEKKKR